MFSIIVPAIIFFLIISGLKASELKYENNYAQIELILINLIRNAVES